MKFIVKLHPEISIKSKDVRKRFTKLLQQNIKTLMRHIDPKAFVENQWDKLIVTTEMNDAKSRESFVDTLMRIPGIVQFLEVEESGFADVHDIYEKIYAVYKEQLEGKSFVVRVKRSGSHTFTSNEVERYVGGGLNQNIESAYVKLKKPDVTVKAEIKDNKLFVVNHTHYAMGGFPLPTQEDVLSLISGGFDSGVSSYHLIRKGARTHYCFFNLGGAEHEIGVKQVSHYIWNQFSRSHKVKFISINFEPVVAEILENVENGQMGVILKRMMMRAAGQVAEKFGIQALVTGESLGQVSSQTLANLNVIDRVTDTLILRPLIHLDKQEIIDTARQIGTEDFAKTMPEYCGVISKKPTVKAVLSKIEREEENFNFDILDQVIADAEVMDIRQIEEQAQQEVKEIEAVSDVAENDVIIDIRSPEEEDDKPLDIEGVEVTHIPFYKIATKFGDLPQDKEYFLYCERGVMSKLQALLLHEKGFLNVKVYRP